MPVARSRAEHQRAGIVAEQRARDAAEMRERGGDPFAPVVAALIEKRFDEEAARVAEDRHEEEDADADAGNLQALLAEIDLQLVARCAFPRARSPAAATRRSRRMSATARSIVRTLTVQSALGEQPLDDDRIARRRPDVQRAGLLSALVRQPPRRRSDLLARLDRLAQIAPHRIHARRRPRAQSSSCRLRDPPASGSRSPTRLRSPAPPP